MSEDINKKKEKISAYLDDALTQAELDTLVDQQQDQESGVASRYQIIGEALRDQMSDASMVDVHLQVREALVHEEIRQVDMDREEIKQESSLDEKHSLFDFISTWFGPNWYKPVGGLAVAASVAMIMVVTTTHEDSAFDRGGLVAENASESVTSDHAPVVSMPVSTVVANEAATSEPVDQSQINMNTYLAEHAEFAAQDTMQGRMPYVRAVSYESE